MKYVVVYKVRRTQTPPRLQILQNCKRLEQPHTNGCSSPITSNYQLTGSGTTKVRQNYNRDGPTAAPPRTMSRTLPLVYRVDSDQNYNSNKCFDMVFPDPCCDAPSEYSQGKSCIIAMAGMVRTNRLALPLSTGTKLQSLRCQEELTYIFRSFPRETRWPSSMSNGTISRSLKT